MLKACDLWFSYGTKTVLCGLELHVESGQVVALVGPNGTGKTTAFSLLCGVLRPDSGDVEIDGDSVLANPIRAKQLIGYIPDEPLLYLACSASENLNLFSLLWGQKLQPERAEETLRRFDLWHVKDQWVSSFSRGMKQRLSFAVALLHKPRLLLLDEPFTGLDMQANLSIRDLLAEFVAGGGAVLFSSHTPEIVGAVASHLTVLHSGRTTSMLPMSEVNTLGGVQKVYAKAISQ